MQLAITSRRFKLTAPIREYVVERFAALDHLGADDYHGSVVVDHDSHHGGREYLLKAHLQRDGDAVNVELRSANLYDGIDALVEALKLQLRRLHDRERTEMLQAGSQVQGL